MALFDKASGVVYTETTSAPVRSMVPTWMSQARGKRDKRSTLRGRGKGCSSLQEMALRSCAWNSENFMPETLQWAGWHYAQRIYEHLLNTDALTFNSWNIFLDAYPAEIRPQQQFHVYPPEEWSFEPTLLPSVVSRMARLDTSLVTLLCIRNFSLTFDDFKELTNIPTLGALILEQSRPHGVSELHARDFLNWGRIVKEKNALQKLRVLVMCDFGIRRSVILEGVASFPSLALIALQNSKSWSMSDAPQHSYGDWSFMTESGLEKRGLTLQDFNPQSIWGSSYHTCSTKAQRLHHLTKTFVQPALDKEAEDRSLCITYGGWTDRSMTHESTAWFIRYSQREPSEVEEIPEISTSAQNREGSTNKKRKMRSGKQMDVGSLLGAFT